MTNLHALGRAMREAQRAYFGAFERLEELVDALRTKRAAEAAFDSALAQTKALNERSGPYDGHVVVPHWPTPEMISAGCEEMHDGPTGVYIAMVAAAPPSEPPAALPGDNAVLIAELTDDYAADQKDTFPNEVIRVYEGERHKAATALEAAEARIAELERERDAARLDATDLTERLLNIGQEAKRQAERAIAAEALDAALAAAPSQEKQS